MSTSRVETASKSIEKSTLGSVRQAAARVTLARHARLNREFLDLAKARSHAAAIKDWVLDNLRPCLEEFEANLVANGVIVHWARDADEANKAISKIVCGTRTRRPVVVKGKSMLSEEIRLNECLEHLGCEVVETDLGEFIVQIDDDSPSHIVAPIIHKHRGQVREAMVRLGLPVSSDDPKELAMAARKHLRNAFQRADVGISGVNFGIVESGRLVIVENEGNNRLCTTAPKVHIALMGIEKLLPRDSDLPLFLRLLAGSATGQRLTVYTHAVHGPRKPDESDGPEEVHVVIVDNGRSRILHGENSRILRCVRCGACQNVCPVYRSATGHAYGHVYGGPVGAVLAAELDGSNWKDLAKASTLCGACHEVCPVEIPIHDMLLNLRQRPDSSAPVRLAANVMCGPLWPLARSLAGFGTRVPGLWWPTHAPLKRVGKDFRKWWNERP